MRSPVARLATLPLVALMVVLAAPAHAQDKLDCDAASTTVDINLCAEIELEEADDLLNATYEKVIARIKKHIGDPPYDAKAFEEAFRAAQRAWIVFRDAECKTVMPFEWGGGTGTTAAVLGCLTIKTEARTKELAGMLDR
jgi:uncharacterized protein YecT (DUF1311 family)